MSANLKGERFEKDVASALESLRQKHPTRVEVVYQPRIALYDGQEVIPDFDLRLDLPFAVLCYLLECQDRLRSEPPILHKIKYIKTVSPRNAFIFVYRTSIPDSTAAALKSDGVVALSFKAFVMFVSCLEGTLEATKQLKVSRGGFLAGLTTKLRRTVARFRLRASEYDKPTIMCDLSPFGKLSRADQEALIAVVEQIIREVPELFRF